MMPRGATIASFVLTVSLAALAGACSPSRFAWGGERSPELARYLASFDAAAGTRCQARLPRAALLERLARERVLWLGDHHTSTALHGLQHELLAELQRRGVRLAFVLEAIGAQDEGEVDRYLRGEQDLAALRAALRRRWPGSWLDESELDAEHFRRLLVFARRHGAPVAAAEPTPRLSLDLRDPWIATAVRAAAARWPDRLLVVHVGQAHLVGIGDLVRRAGLGGFVLGGETPDSLTAAAPADLAPGELWQSDGGLWWFGAPR